MKWLKTNWENIGLISIAALSLVLSIRLYKRNFSGSFSSEHTHWAEFGAYIGGTVGAIFAVLAFYVLYRTLLVTKKELSETKLVLENQLKTSQQQNFDSLFFQMLRLQNDILDNIEYNNIKHNGEDQLIYGREAIRNLVVLFQNYYLNAEMSNNINNKNNLLRHRDAYKKFNVDYGYSYSHYYRLIHNIFQLIDSSNFNVIEQEKYLGILRSQLSKYEVLLLFYNSLSEMGSEKSIPLLIKLNLFKHLDKDALLDYHDLADRLYLKNPSLKGELLFEEIMTLINQEKLGSG